MVITEVTKYNDPISGEEVENMVKATVDGVIMFIPTTDDNDLYYSAILDWVAEGNTIADA